ncbi:MAG: hypothetical protein ACRCTZ_17830 [Sarcina sp.]
MSRQKKQLKRKAEKELKRKEVRKESFKRKQERIARNKNIKSVMQRKLSLLAMVSKAKDDEIKNGNNPTTLKVPLQQFGFWEELLQSDGKIQGLDLSSWDIDDMECIEINGYDIYNDVVVM